MKVGRLDIHLPDDQLIVLGGDKPGPHAALFVKDLALFRKVVLYGNIGLGEAYMDGDWDTPDLRAVIEWFIHNLRSQIQIRGSSQKVKGLGWMSLANRVLHLLRPNSLRMSQRNIAEHYDLGNDFYKLWLDPTMTYSAARFTSENQTLEQAQRAKYEALCQKLRLQPGDRVLEIGCGWGGFSIHAATHYGCHITGITISEAQLAEATRRVREAGLADKIDLRMQDYRTLEGQFDKIASIEMLEAVGDKYLETYFAKCDALLLPHGLLAFQCITVPDNEYDDLRRGSDWIQKHIFPGSLLLGVARMNQAINRTTNLGLHTFEDMGAGYARTLREWWLTFNSKLEEVRRLGFDERFIRKWNYYLRYCEAAFATRNVSVIQACYTKPGNTSLHHEGGVS
jgi:cyclopropane-fatty-acyl-phospholipid synthase